MCLRQGIAFPKRLAGGMMPYHDHPVPSRAHRVYVALTNHCNRSCPWCCTYSGPERDTWITWEALSASLPEGNFEIQMEGGEPTLHPDFWKFVEYLRANPRCTKLVLCTNGTTVPREALRLHGWLSKLGEPLLIKLSVNHHLLECDTSLLSLVSAMRDTLAELGGERAIVCNVRLRKGFDDDDRPVVAAIEETGLLPISNVFYLQRYGLAADETGWNEPFLVGHDFRMVNPDGQVFGQDLVARSEAMGKLK